MGRPKAAARRMGRAVINMIYIYGLFCLWAGVIYAVSLGLSRRAVLKSDIYLWFIAAVFLPFLIAAGLTAMAYHPAVNLKANGQVMSVLSAAVEIGHRVTLSSMLGTHIGSVFWALYLVVATGLALRVFLSLRLLWAIGPIQAGLIVSPDIIDPACLPWPRRAILMPADLDGKARDYVLAHERAHQKYYDAEVTLMLCLLGAVFWLNRPLAGLIRQWRFAIELRADAQVLNGAPRTSRKDYAALLLQHIAAHNGPHKNRHGGARPCPSMALIPDQKRRTEMRLKAILNVNGDKRKPRWAARLAVSGLCAAGLGGGIGLSALAGDADNAARIEVIKRVPPVFPANCIPKDNPPVVKTSPSGRDIHGWVKLRFNVDKNGVPYDIKAFESSKACFEANSIASVTQWRYAPGRTASGLENMLYFIQTP